MSKLKIKINLYVNLYQNKILILNIKVILDLLTDGPQGHQRVRRQQTYMQKKARFRWDTCSDTEIQIVAQKLIEFIIYSLKEVFIYCLERGIYILSERGIEEVR